MKVSLDWLREYAVLDAPLDTLVEGLIETGTEVEHVSRGPAGVVVALRSTERKAVGVGSWLPWFALHPRGATAGRPRPRL